MNDQDKKWIAIVGVRSPIDTSDINNNRIYTLIAIETRIYVAGLNPKESLVVCTQAEGSEGIALEAAKTYDVGHRLFRPEELLEDCHEMHVWTAPWCSPPLIVAKAWEQGMPITRHEKWRFM